MAVLGLGLDVVELERLDRVHRRHGDAFIRRICRDGECAERSGDALLQHLGGLWAAKEAVLKALGTGWAEGLGFAQVEVVRDRAGAPGVRLHEAAARRADALGVARVHLSISHERRYAAAVAILEGAPSASDPAAPGAPASSAQDSPAENSAETP